MQPKWTCPTCGYHKGTLDSGHFVCGACATADTNYIEEIVEDQTDYSSTSRWTTRMGGRGRKKAVEVVLSGHDRVKLALELFQKLLMEQCKVLFQEKGCSKKILYITGRIFTGMLKAWREEGWGEEDDDNDNGDGDNPKSKSGVNLVLVLSMGGGSSGYLMKKDKSKYSAGELSLPLSLAICILAARYVGDPLCSYDLCFWACNGEIPYFGCTGSKRFSEEFMKKVCARPELLVFLTPRAPPSVRNVNKALDYVNELLMVGDSDWYQPSFTNAPEQMAMIFVERYVEELLLPRVLIPMCQSLSTVKPIRKNPEVVAMSLLLFAATVHFDLHSHDEDGDGSGRSIGSSSKHTSSHNYTKDWVSWVHRIHPRLDTLAASHRIPASRAEAWTMPQVADKGYIDFFKTCVVYDQKAPSDLAPVLEYLQSIVDDVKDELPEDAVDGGSTEPFYPSSFSRKTQKLNSGGGAKSSRSVELKYTNGLQVRDNVPFTLYSQWDSTGDMNESYSFMVLLLARQAGIPPMHLHSSVSQLVHKWNDFANSVSLKQQESKKQDADDIEMEV